MSEANGGAGEGAKTVFGLILGTGCGGGLCQDGRLVQALAGLPGEVGHLGIPISFSGRLPNLHCKCGRHGCYETLISGPGLRRLGQHVTGQDRSVEAITTGARAGEPGASDTMALWAEVVAELLLTLQAAIDPHRFVLGGGLSNSPGLLDLLRAQLPKTLMEGVPLPELALARFGDASGVRGAAMLHQSL